MFGQQPSIALVPISGNGARPSFFGGTVQQRTGFHPTLGGGYWMGQTPTEWYNRAKRALAQFEALLTRVASIANQTSRNEILAWIGTTGDVDSAAYRYGAVKSDLQQDVEAFTPPAVNAYQVGRRTSRIEKLEEFNTELEAKVTNAESVYGKLPAPVVIERERITTPGSPASGTNWTLPLVVGGGAVAVAVLVTLLAGGKG